MRRDTGGICVLPNTVASHNGQRLEAMASVAPQSLANEHGKGHSADSPGRGGGGMLVGHALLVVVQVVALTMHLASQGSVQDNPRCAQAVVEAGKGLRVRPAGGLGLRRQTRGRKVLFPLVAERDPADRAPASSLWTVINGNLACSRNDEGIEQIKGSDYGTTLEACKVTCLQAISYMREPTVCPLHCGACTGTRANRGPHGVFILFFPMGQSTVHTHTFLCRAKNKKCDVHAEQHTLSLGVHVTLFSFTHPPRIHFAGFTPSAVSDMCTTWW